MQLRTNEDTLSAWAWLAWQAAQAAAEKAEPVAWSLDAPTSAGTYLHKCGETGYEIERLEVFESDGVLWVSSDIGNMPVGDYHNGLTDPMWAETSAHPVQAEPPQYRAMWLKVKEELDTLKLRGGNGEAEPPPGVATAPSEVYEAGPPHPMQAKPLPTMSEALAAGDGLLHSRIDELGSAIEEQTRTIGALNMCIGGKGSTSTENITRIAALEAQVAALTKAKSFAELYDKVDAARYRWLRDAKGLELRSDGSNWSRHGESFVAPFSMAANGTRYGAFDSLDKLIDAAIAAQKGTV
jgi:hypothetical protein